VQAIYEQFARAMVEYQVGEMLAFAVVSVLLAAMWKLWDLLSD